MIKSENYINVCGWMISELADLRLNEIFIYAIIHGFSQDGKSFYTGSLSYLMEWTHSSKPTVIAALSKMVEKGYIIKKLINGVTPIYFTARSRMMDLGMSVEVVKNYNHQSKNLTEGSKKTLPPQLKNFTPNGKESLPNDGTLLQGTKVRLEDEKGNMFGTAGFDMKSEHPVVYHFVDGILDSDGNEPAIESPNHYEIWRKGLIEKVWTDGGDTIEYWEKGVPVRIETNVIQRRKNGESI